MFKLPVSLLRLLLSMAVIVLVCVVAHAQTATPGPGGVSGGYVDTTPMIAAVGSDMRTAVRASICFAPAICLSFVWFTLIWQILAVPDRGIKFTVDYSASERAYARKNDWFNRL